MFIVHCINTGYDPDGVEWQYPMDYYKHMTSSRSVAKVPLIALLVEFLIARWLLRNTLIGLMGADKCMLLYFSLLPLKMPLLRSSGGGGLPSTGFYPVLQRYHPYGIGKWQGDLGILHSIFLWAVRTVAAVPSGILRNAIFKTKIPIDCL